MSSVSPIACLGMFSPEGRALASCAFIMALGRVYFKQRGSEIVILLCGGDKSTQQHDIETAQRLAAEWEAS